MLAKNTALEMNAQRYFTTLEVQMIKCWKLIQTQKYENQPRHRKDLLELYPKFYEGKASIVQTTLVRFLQRNKAFSF